MEKPEIRTQKSSLETPPFSFPLHRRSHLKSETYRTLVRILSHCYGQSDVSLVTPIAPLELIRPEDDDSTGSGQETEKEMHEPGEVFGPVSTEPENFIDQQSTVINKDFEVRRFNETQRVMDEIEHVMQIEENEGTLKQKDLTADYGPEGASFHDRFYQQQMLIDELELIMKGNEKLLPDSDINLSSVSLDGNQSSTGVAASANDEEQQLDLQQIVMEKPGNASQLQADKNSQKISQVFDCGLEKHMTGEVLKPSENSQEQSSSVKANLLEGGHEMRKKEMESEKTVGSSGTLPSTNFMIEDVDIEEGEISGEIGVNDESIDMLLRDALPSEGQVNENQVSEDVIDKRDFHCNREIRTSKKESEPTSFTVDTNHDRELELEESATCRMLLNAETLVPQTSILAEEAERDNCMPSIGENKRKGSRTEDFGCWVACPSGGHGGTEEQIVSENQGISSKEKLDAVASHKKKRGPLSKEKKAKKKLKERKKRAEENRRLGVKRLKLRPVMKPKTVTYCRHYLNGRCHEGDKCKFSHDTIPLTKSKPCCHFARRSCMKGDDCPFDHQLSKYPCTTFVTKGFCSKGNDCMFSHKMLPKQDALSATDALKSKAAPSLLLDTLHLKKQSNISGPSHQNVDASSYSVLSCKSSMQNVTETLLNPHALPTRGSSSFSAGELSVQSSKPNQSISSPKINEVVKVGNQTSPNASHLVQNMKGILMGTPPAMTPKGLNFLSFGKASSVGSSSRKLAGSPLNKKDGFRSSLANNLSLHEQAGSSSSRDNNFDLSNQATQSVSNPYQNLNEMLKKSLSRRDLTDDSGSKGQANFSSSLCAGLSSTVQENGNASDKHPNPSVKQPKLVASPLTSGQSLDQLARGCCRNTPTSTQKALISALAFAAKIESDMKINSSASSSLAVSKDEMNSSHGGPKSDSSKILAFLSSLSSKTKQ